jgi:hypothetical protein
LTQRGHNATFIFTNLLLGGCGPLCHIPAVKDELLKARVSKALKHQIARLAEDRGESEAVIIREALNAYVTREEAATATPPVVLARPPAKPVSYIKHPKRKAG